MIIVDTALRRREDEGRPLRVALIGAGFMARGLANQITNSVPGMRVAAVYARKLEQGLDLCEYASLEGAVVASTQADVEDAVRADRPVVTDDAFLLCRAEQIDALVDVTGSVEFGAQVVLEAVEHGKHVILMNAELDATLGPILNVYAKRAGVMVSACDGDEPGLQMNLVRWVQGIGLTPRVIGNVKGLQDPYRNPETQRALRREVAPEPGDGDLVRRRLEDQLRADDRRERDRLQGPRARHVPRRQVRRLAARAALALRPRRDP